MAGKVTGLGSTVTIDDSGGTGRDISNDVTNYDLSTPRGVAEITGVDKSAMERQLLLADYSISLNGIVNTDANKSHDVFKTVPSSSTTRTVVTVQGGATLTAECIFSTYDVTRDADGKLPWKAEGALANGTAPAWS